MTTSILIDDLSFSYPDDSVPALENVSLSISVGQLVALLGPSGAGKTTLLTLLDGRLKGWRGSVSVLGKSLDPNRFPPRERRVETGFVFQEFALVERSTVMRNVLNGRLGRMQFLRAFLGRTSTSDADAAKVALFDCGILDLADRRVDTLSGGQRQRVAIARCLAQEPELILADEPVSNLDPTRAADVLTLLTRAARARGTTVLFSTHQPELARSFADRVIGVRNGRIVLETPVSDLSDGATVELYRDDDHVAGTRLQVVR